MPPGRNCSTGQSAKPDKYHQQKSLNFNKTAACSHHCPLWHEHNHWGIGVPGYSFGSTIKARAIPPPSHGSALPVTTSSQKSFQLAFPPSTQPKKRLFSLFMIIYSDYGKNVWYFTKFIPLAAEFIYLATSAECAWSINQPTAVKGLKSNFFKF